MRLMVKLIELHGGKIEILSDEVLGVKTNRNSSNWFMKIGGDGLEVIVAGCQIHYVVRCDDKPQVKDFTKELDHELETKEVRVMSRIYLAQKEGNNE